jgi:hypothetical protein
MRRLHYVKVLLAQGTSNGRPARVSSSKPFKKVSVTRQNYGGLVKGTRSRMQQTDLLITRARLNGYFGVPGLVSW